MANIQSDMKIKGLDQTLKRLKKLEPDYVKEMNRQIRKEAAPTVKSIKDYLKFIDSDITPFNSSGGDSRITQGELIKGRGGATAWNKQLILRGIRFKLGGPKRKAPNGKQGLFDVQHYPEQPRWCYLRHSWGARWQFPIH